ncbi:MAG: MerR family transcriptional regulator [Acidobacteriota bacterium]
MGSSKQPPTSQPPPLTPDKRHPISVVARRTGLQADLIRAWERRYGAVVPSRAENQRRLYSDADIERLKLLKQAIQEGRAIGQVANLSDEDLRSLIAEDQAALAALRASTTGKPINPFGTATPGTSPAPGAPAPVNDPMLVPPASIPQYLRDAMIAIENLDSRRLSHLLQQASVSLSQVNLIDQFIVPMMRQVGDRWRQGQLRPAHEHLATSVVRNLLMNLPGAFKVSRQAPHILITTPAGQYHELGALLAAATANAEGWQVTYLGVGLPAEEIVAAAHQLKVRAIGLGITYPPDDPDLPAELERLRHLMPQMDFIFGGRCMSAYEDVIESISGHPVHSLNDLRGMLIKLRNQATTPKAATSFTAANKRTGAPAYGMPRPRAAQESSTGISSREFLGSRSRNGNESANNGSRPAGSSDPGVD